MGTFELQILEYINSAIRQSRAQALILGSRPGGYVGQLPQTRVQYDINELATSGTPISGYSMLDNLNHIRYRIQVLESGGTPSSFSGAFTDLSDTPSTYTGNAGKILIVNATESGIEFTSYVPSSGTTTLSGIASNDAVFFIDGALASGIAMSYSYVVPRNMTISGIFAYVETPGDSGDTIIDVNKNGTTLFTTQANRPSVAYNDTSSIKAVPDITELLEGDIITIDIDTVAEAAEDLTIVIAANTNLVEQIVQSGASTFIELSDTPIDYTGDAGKFLVVNPTEDGIIFSGYTPSDFNLTVKEADGNPSISNISTIVFSGAIISDDGGGQVTVTVSGGTSTGTFIQHSQAVLTVGGVLSSTGVKPLRIYTPDVASGATIEEIYVAVNTAPASTALRVRVLKGGSTIFSGTDYIEVSLGSNTASRTTNFVSTSLSKNDYFTIEIVQGDSTASDLSVHIRYKWTLDSD
jgi:hypothetical protein